MKQTSIFSNTIIGIIILNEQGIIKSVNNKFLDLMGYENTQLTDKHFSNFVIELDKNKVSRYFNSGDEPQSKTIEARIRNSKKKLLLIELELVPPRANEKQHYLGFIKEYSSNNEKEKKIESLKETQQEVFKKLEEEKELSELKTRFVSMASHEFRTPLAGILSSLQLIRRYLDSEKGKWDKLVNKGKVETHFHKIEESVLNMNIILNDFLSLGKIEDNKISLKYNWFNLSSFLDSMCQELEPLYKPGQKVNYTHYGDVEDIYLDKHILRNIINNLISNAIKYSANHTTIEVTSRQAPSLITIKVKDEGIGIPIKEHNNIFRRFFRARNAVNYQGTGLGLNIVKRYTELMNGNITFESQENKGTTFCVTFPVNKTYK